jgi:hypothetical protein
MKPLVVVTRRNHDTVILAVVFSISWLIALSEWGQALHALKEALIMAGVVYLVQVEILARAFAFGAGVRL